MLQNHIIDLGTEESLRIAHRQLATGRPSS